MTGVWAFLVVFLSLVIILTVPAHRPGFIVSGGQYLP
jgi:hypothetical protein